ncbi:MAG: hypothetical protein ACD_28C00178G0006 [uncultured bacterium]|nr:MAG: hypothetical protein ACD_28C00178G0006 [uncultured bacterium]KKT73921.1 MAG: Nucleotidyltransferase family protein [Candidatus Peregrinibacteria bacterium GW2011_GWA2_44_7]
MPLTQAILATLSYFDGVFGFPLTLEEASKHLLNAKITHPSLNELKKALENCDKIEKINNRYQLKKIMPSLKNSDTLPSEIEQEIVAKHWKKVKRFQWVFTLVPYLELVAVCNNLSFNHVTQSSDIDLLVVTKPNRLFIGRLLLTFWLQILGIRRHGNKIAGRFCLSFFITSHHLNLETIKIHDQDIYLAYWLKTLQPVMGKKEIYDQLLDQNASWLSFFFKTPLEPQLHHFKPSSKTLEIPKKIQEKILNTRWGDRLETYLEHWQTHRAQSKQKTLSSRSSIMIKKDMLKFHNVDRRKEFYETWQKVLRQINQGADKDLL